MESIFYPHIICEIFSFMNIASDSDLLEELVSSKDTKSLINSIWRKNMIITKQYDPNEMCDIIYVNGICHSLDDKPCITAINGFKSWYKNNKLHRDNGPAILRPDGSYEWYKNGKLHREDGPAVMNSNGTKRWYRNGLMYRNLIQY